MYIWSFSFQKVCANLLSPSVWELPSLPSCQQSVLGFSSILLIGNGVLFFQYTDIIYQCNKGKISWKYKNIMPSFYTGHVPSLCSWELIHAFIQRVLPVWLRIQRCVSPTPCDPRTNSWSREEGRHTKQIRRGDKHIDSLWQKENVIAEEGEVDSIRSLSRLPAESGLSAEFKVNKIEWIWSSEVWLSHLIPEESEA